MQKSCVIGKIRWAVAVAGIVGTAGPLNAAEPTSGESTLPEVSVRDSGERPDGPVTGYRATRSGTFTKTDTPLKEVPASLSIVPSGVMKDAAMQGMGDAFKAGAAQAAATMQAAVDPGDKSKK